MIIKTLSCRAIDYDVKAEALTSQGYRELEGRVYIGEDLCTGAFEKQDIDKLIKELL